MRDFLSKVKRRIGRPVEPDPGDSGLFGGLPFEESSRFRPIRLLPDASVLWSGELASAEDPQIVFDEPLAAPFLTLQLDRLESGQAGAASWGLLSGGLKLFAEFSSQSRKISLLLEQDGERSVLTERRLKSDHFPLSLTVTENHVVLWQGEDLQAKPVLKAHLRESVDLRQKQVFQDLRIAGTGDGYRLKAGYFGYLGLRDPQFVRDESAEIYHRDGRAWLTMSCAGPGFFPTAHWAVFSLDPAQPEDLRLEAQLFSERDGMLLGDHAGSLTVRKNDILVTVSSWGDFDENAHIRWTQGPSGLLQGVHLLRTARLELPTDYDSWDPTVLRFQDRWWIAFVECLGYQPRFDFRPVLAVGEPGQGFSTEFRRIGADEMHHQTEGTLLMVEDGELLLLASDGDARDYPIYNTEMFRFSQLAAPYKSNIPHPVIYQHEGVRWMLTFDGTPFREKKFGYGTHGDVLIYRQVEAGS